VNLTEANLRILVFIKAFWLKNYCSPTLREIVAGLDHISSISVASYHANRLRDLGFLKETPKYTSRALIPTDMVIVFSGGV